MAQPIVAAQLVDDGSGARIVPAHAGVMSQTSNLPIKWAPSVSPLAATSQDERDALLATAAAASPEALLTLVIQLDDVPSDWTSFREATSDASRTAFIESRKQAIQSAQAPLTGWLDSVGARFHASFWLSNTVTADVPAAQVAALLRRQDVRSVGSATSAGTSRTHASNWYDGYWTQKGMNTLHFHQKWFDGSAGGRTSGPIKVAVIDQGALPLQHHGWQWPIYLNSRIVTYQYCNGNGCAPTTEGYPPSVNHGTFVTGIAVGSIEGGQDPAFPLPPTRIPTMAERQRSGQAIESQIFLL